MPRSIYYYYIIQAKKPEKYKDIKKEITAIYHENYRRYGYQRITIELRHRGYCIRHKTVQQPMADLKLKCMVRFKKYRSYKGEAERTAPNLIERNFKASAPNQKWSTDVTEFALFETKLYLSLILDMYNSEIISNNINERPILGQVIEMLDKAFAKIPDHMKLIFHSDQG